MGSSVKVPHYGSKTIRVKLTVSPDQRKHVSATVIEQDNKGDSEKPLADPIKRDLNVTIKHAHEKKRNKNSKQKDNRYQHHCCNHHEEGVEDNSDEFESSSHVSDMSDEEEEGECSGDEQIFKTKQKKTHKATTPRYTIPNLFIRENNIFNKHDGCLRSRRATKRSSSLQRQELLEIIRANMDKNNLSFQSGRWVQQKLLLLFMALYKRFIYLHTQHTGVQGNNGTNYYKPKKCRTVIVHQISGFTIILHYFLHFTCCISWF